MGVRNLLSVLGGDVVKVFAFISSPKGQAVVATGEGLAFAAAGIAAGPVAANAVGKLVGVANNWFVEIMKAQSLASAAGQGEGSGAGKAASVLAVMTPQILAFAKEEGFPAPLAEEMAAGNDALVAFFKAFALGSVAPPSPVSSKVQAGAVQGTGIGAAVPNHGTA